MALRALSRGFAAHIHAVHLTTAGRARSQLIPSFRCFSAETISHSSNLVQVYISRSTDPYLNLSIEHFLLQQSHPDSVILFLYTNRPCVVIGRNQNPWVEVNLHLINQNGPLEQQPRKPENVEAAAISNVNGNAQAASSGEGEQGGDEILLVRRRSGGGTVFHDTGNVNYGVICHRDLFDRDKHAEMVARALRGLNKIPHGVRVNERHDIVLDVSTTPGQQGTDGDVKTYKISGSAYKITRTRSLHHGTCLLSSPRLPFLSQLLRSPAAPYIRARGVESVRSPVRNVGISNAEFEDAVVREFIAMYKEVQAPAEPQTEKSEIKEEVLDAADVEHIPEVQNEKSEIKVEVLDAADVEQIPEVQNEKNEIKVEVLDAADVEQIPEIQAGVAKLKSRDWIYAQTPQFSFSSHPTADDPRPRPDLPADLPSWFFPSDPALNSTNSTNITKKGTTGLQMTVRHAEITGVIVPTPNLQADKPIGRILQEDKKAIARILQADKAIKRIRDDDLRSSLKGLHLHHIDDWRKHMGRGNEGLGRWLNGLFGISGGKNAR